jgi:hypothetical protein
MVALSQVITQPVDPLDPPEASAISPPVVREAKLHRRSAMVPLAVLRELALATEQREQSVRARLQAIAQPQVEELQAQALMEPVQELTEQALARMAKLVELALVIPAPPADTLV